MSKIRSSDTKPELRLRKALWSVGLRYRINVKKLPGKPDIAIKKYRIAIFVDGEFWHGFNWEEKRKKLVNNREFWINKIETNMLRDKKNKSDLERLGFIVLRFWDFEVNKNLGYCVKTVLDCVYSKSFNNFHTP
jgi:DNA mismatch endonuclease (patch repair protein)